MYFMGDNTRYSRQTVLPEIGVSGQEQISGASVLCIGAGGLGCPALLYLAAAGVGRIGIVDFDRVDESNLQRQILFDVDQVGDNKAIAAKARLSALNPDVTINAYPERLTDQNAEDLFAQYDLIIDGTDNFASKYLINDCAVKTGKPFIYGSILGFEGQVSVFNYNDGPCYRCLFPHAPTGHIPNCAEAGVIGAVAGIIGTMQAVEAIKIIVEHDSFQILSGTLHCLDTRSMSSKTLNLPRDEDCAVCSINTHDIVLEKNALGACDLTSEIDVAGLVSTDAVIIDVREDNEWAAGHIKGAKHFALSRMVDGNYPDFPHQDSIVLYCQKGMRSIQAAQVLQSHGWKNVHSLRGGYDAFLQDENSTLG